MIPKGDEEQAMQFEYIVNDDEWGMKHTFALAALAAMRPTSRLDFLSTRVQVGRYLRYMQITFQI